MPQRLGVKEFAVYRAIHVERSVDDAVEAVAIQIAVAECTFASDADQTY